MKRRGAGLAIGAQAQGARLPTPRRGGIEAMVLTTVVHVSDAGATLAKHLTRTRRSTGRCKKHAAGDLGR